MDSHVIEGGICPACGKKTLRTVILEKDLPHFGRAVIATSKCSSCGYTHTDVIELEDRGRKQLVLHVDDERKLNYLVVRSSSAHVSIPEQGLELFPGPFSNGFITTVEGILERFERAAMRMIPETDEGKRRKEEVLEWIKRARKGKEQFTLVIDDPRGVSGIIGPDDES